jgi:hypothetical protein
MDTALLIRKFEKIGARLLINAPDNRRWRASSSRNPFAIDIRSDHKGEFFDLRLDPAQVHAIDAIDVQPHQRHLLLLAWLRIAEPARPAPNWKPTSRNGHLWNAATRRPTKPRFLCGHDERHWFVAAIPEAAHASTVRTAMEALKPDAVLAAQAAAAIPFPDRFARHNRAFRRQGEWFFLPRPTLVVPAHALRTDEPLQRSGGKPHIAQFAFRQGGEPVYVSPQHPRGLTEPQYHALLNHHPELRGRFRIMRRNPTLFVRGRISHPDHATITLHQWHQVLMNTGNQAAARSNVAFLD